MLHQKGKKVLIIIRLQNKLAVNFGNALKMFLILGTAFEVRYSEGHNLLLVAMVLIFIISFSYEMKMYIDDPYNEKVLVPNLLCYYVMFSILSLTTGGDWVVLASIPLLTMYIMFKKVALSMGVGVVSLVLNIISDNMSKVNDTQNVNICIDNERKS